MSGIIGKRMMMKPLLFLERNDRLYRKYLI